MSLFYVSNPMTIDLIQRLLRSLVSNIEHPRSLLHVRTDAL